MDNKVRRIGIVAPPGNVAMEREIPPFLPPGVVMNHNRLSRPGSAISRDSLLAMAESVDRAAHDLAQAYPEVIVYGCTSGSFLEGIGKEARLADRITQVTGIKAVTTSTAVVEALQAHRARRIFMITPYPDDVNKHEFEFCQHYGLDVVGFDSFRCPTSEDIRAISSEQTAALALNNKAAIAACDTIFISCTNLLAMDQVEKIEAESGRPVVTSNQASLWAGLCRMGVDMRGIRCGSLFQHSTIAKAA
jgi:maleate isomerase